MSVRIITLRIVSSYPHACDQRDLLRFARADEAHVEGANDRIAACGDQGAHVESRSYRGAAAPHHASPAEGTTIARERRHTRERRDTAPIQLAEFWEFAKARPAHHGTDPGHRAKEVLSRAPDGTALDRVVEVTVDSRELPFEPLNVCANAAPDRNPGMLEPIAFGPQHPHELPPARQQRVEGLRCLIGQRTRRRTDPLGEQRQDVGVETIRRGQLAGRPSEVADLPRVDHHHRLPPRGQRRHGRSFIAPRRLNHYEDGCEPLQALT